MLWMLLLCILHIAAQECEYGFELFSTGCNTNEDCGNANGHDLECLSGYCICRENIYCDTSATLNASSQFESCVYQPCVNGSGFSYTEQAKHEVCAQPLSCVNATNPDSMDELSHAICLTCETCLAQNGDYECSTICNTGSGSAESGNATYRLVDGVTRTREESSANKHVQQIWYIFGLLLLYTLI